MRATVTNAPPRFAVVLCRNYRCAPINSSYLLLAHNLLTTTAGHTMSPSPVLDQVRALARRKQLSLRTEARYVQAIRRCIRLHDQRHPATMGAAALPAYRTHRAVAQRLAGATITGALSAIVLRYRALLRIDLPPLDTLPRSQPTPRVPVVFTRTEVPQLLGELTGVQRLLAQLRYGSGLRLLECARLRVKDLDGA